MTRIEILLEDGERCRFAHAVRSVLRRALSPLPLLRKSSAAFHEPHCSSRVPANRPAREQNEYSRAAPSASGSMPSTSTTSPSTAPAAAVSAIAGASVAPARRSHARRSSVASGMPGPSARTVIPAFPATKSTVSEKDDRTDAFARRIAAIVATPTAMPETVRKNRSRSFAAGRRTSGPMSAKKPVTARAVRRADEGRARRAPRRRPNASP